MSRILRNVTAFVIGDAGSRVIGFFVTVYLVRVLAPEAFGTVTVGLALLGYLGLLASPGVQILETRNVAASPVDLPKRVGAVISLRLLLAVVIALAAWGVARVVVEERRTADVIGLYGACLIPMALLLDWWFQGKEDFRALGGSRVVQFLVYALAAILMVRSTDDLEAAPKAFFLGGLAGSVFLLVIYAIRAGSFPLHFRPALWRRILSENVPVGGAVLAAQAATSLPPIVVAAVLGAVAAAEYGAAMRLVFMFLFIDRLVHALLLPALSRQLARDRHRARMTAAVVLKLQIVFLVPLGLLLMLGGEQILSLLYGHSYAPAVPLLQVMVSYVLLTLMNTVFVCVLIGGGKERDYSRIMTVGSTLMAILVVVLTIAVGSLGAALGVVIGEALVTLWMSVRAREVLLLIPSWRLASVVLLVACAGPCLVFRPEGGLGVGVAVALTVYLLAVVMLGGVRRDDLRLLRESLI